jgi:hypothetical protein
MSTPFPTGGRAIIEKMTAQFPGLFVNDDDKQRQLTTKIGEQFAFAFGPQWGNKKRANLSDDFRSKDSIAVREADGTTSVWDMFSSGLAILVNDGDLPVPGSHANLPPSEATFMPCPPVDHLNGGTGGRTGGNTGGTTAHGTPVDLGPVLAKLEAQTAEIASLRGLVQQLLDRPAPQITVPPVVFPVYEGDVTIRPLATGRVTLHPKTD